MFAVAADHGRDGAGIGHYKFAEDGIPQEHAEGHIAGLNLALDQNVVESLHQLGGTAAARRQGTEQAADQAAEQARPRYPCR